MIESQYELMIVWVWDILINQITHKWRDISMNEWMGK